MADNIVDLDRYRRRKQRKDRKDRKDKAPENRARHGRSKPDRAADDLARERDEAELDGKKLETDDDEA
jgi:hypothetical protein